MGSNDDRPPDVASDDSAEAMAKRGEWAAAYRALAEGDRGGAFPPLIKKGTFTGVSDRLLAMLATARG